ncbi:MAG: hypothetical protein GXX79_13355 [Actinomycetales bacterium]|nr:hypothetical protein [Actinomycetales bacterium]
MARVAVLSVVVLVGAAGCTPADKKVAAVRSVNGHPTLLIAPCAEADIDSISVYPIGSSERRWWTIDRESGSTPEAVTLLEVPPGWTARTEDLTRLEPGASYGVSAFGSPRHAASVQFTQEALAGLRPDQVLVGEPPSGWRVVSERAFRAEARKDCS